MARAFYSLMAGAGSESAEEISADATCAVHDGVDAVLERAGGARSGLMAASMDLALERTTA